MTDRPDPLQLRVGDAEREQVAEALRDALASGRIDADELEERLSTTYAAKTVGDLVPVTADLPSPVAGSRPTSPVQPAAGLPDRVVPGPEHTRHVAVMGGIERSGDWIVPEHMSVLCFWGGADLDLRDARFAAREVTVSVTAIMGGCQLTVDEDTDVVMEGLGIMGGFGGPSSIVPSGDDAVTVRVTGVAIMGGVSVTRKPAESDGGRSLRRKRS